MESCRDALAGGDESPGSASAGRDQAADDLYAAALDHYLAIGGPDLEGRAAGVLADLGLDPDQLPQATATLSGGELARAALAAILLSQVDLLLLDEPTNDLDAEGLARLEDFLARPRRHAAGRLARPRLPRAHRRPGARARRVHPRGAAVRRWIRGVRRRARAREGGRAGGVRGLRPTRQGLVDRARREKEWAQQGVGRATSAKARREERDKFIRAANVAGAQARGAAAAKTLRALDRLDAVDDPREPWDLRLRLAVSSRSGDDVAGLREAVVRRGGSPSGRSTCTSPAATASRSPAQRAPARRRCWRRCWGGPS